ncbi:hypothetical protein N9M32_02590 [Alphaproteobacteria bacterium]|nr:hypothetical protein [Alphaproteobacteria bacterium]
MECGPWNLNSPGTLEKITKMILRVCLGVIFAFAAYAKEPNNDYCIGYLEEVYWALDPIEDEKVRANITEFFNQHYVGADLLNFDLLYDPSQRQFVNSPSDNLIKVNYPNFEIMILDAYINLFTDSDQNYCPAFWDDCSEESLKSFFHGASDFSNQWVGEDRVIEYLDTDFKNHQCTQYLNTSINKTEFIPNLNILIKELTK